MLFFRLQLYVNVILFAFCLSTCNINDAMNDILIYSKYII